MEFSLTPDVVDSLLAAIDRMSWPDLRPKTVHDHIGRCARDPLNDLSAPNDPNYDVVRLVWELQLLNPAIACIRR